LTVPYVTSAIETLDPFHDHWTRDIEVCVQKFVLIPAFLKLNTELWTKSTQESSKASTYHPRSIALLQPRVGSTYNPLAYASLHSSSSDFHSIWSVQIPTISDSKSHTVQVLYSTLPLLIPILFSSLIGYFLIASRSSSVRIKKLEADALASEQTRLIDVVESFERQVEESVVDSVETQSFELSPSPTSHPIIKDTHRKIAGWLNTLPLKKELAYFPDIPQTHATIVSRDIQRFEFHKRGQPILQHLADSLLV